MLRRGTTGLKRVGIYPGAFDPVHKGHIAFAEEAIKAHKLDKIFFLPEPSPRHKQGVKALEHRIAMIQLAIAKNPQFGLIQLEQRQFTIHHTWPIITARFASAELYMLLGSDVASRLASWPDIGEFARTTPHIIVAMRREAIAAMHETLETLKDIKMLDISYDVIDSKYAGYSSLQARKFLKQGKQPDSIDDTVWGYIRANGLYSSAAA